jgi:hypothetical protein
VHEECACTQTSNYTPPVAMYSSEQSLHAMSTTLISFILVRIKINRTCWHVSNLKSQSASCLLRTRVITSGFPLCASKARSGDIALPIQGFWSVLALTLAKLRRAHNLISQMFMLAFLKVLCRRTSIVGESAAGQARSAIGKTSVRPLTGRFD